jgi:hypothetical protein
VVLYENEDEVRRAIEFLDYLIRCLLASQEFVRSMDFGN